MISFSLYLVHEPWVIAVGSSVPRPIETVLVAAPLCLVVAVGFYYAIERPSHRLAQRVRRGIEAESLTKA